MINLNKDEWLSQYFEYGAYRYDAPFDMQNFPKGFIYAKVPAEKLDQVNTLIQHGFKVIEVLLQFEQKNLLVLGRPNPFTIEFSCTEDKAAAAEIAGEAFAFSRFYQDDKISKSTASQIKSDWVSNYFTGQRGDNLIVARDKGHIVGFLLLVEKNIIDLIAVSAGYMGKGIGSAMIRYANQQVGMLKAGTQIINKPSLALYKKMGFFLQNGNFVLHRHVI